MAIVGESGSGKSVFTKTFTGMLEDNGFISGGEIYLEILKQMSLMIFLNINQIKIGKRFVAEGLLQFSRSDDFT